MLSSYYDVEVARKMRKHSRLQPHHLNPIDETALREELTQEFTHEMYNLLTGFGMVYEEGYFNLPKLYRRNVEHTFNRFFPVIKEPYRFSWPRMHEIVFNGLGRMVVQKDSEWGSPLSSLELEGSWVSDLISNPEPRYLFLIKSNLADEVEHSNGQEESGAGDSNSKRRRYSDGNAEEHVEWNPDTPGPSSSFAIDAQDTMPQVVERILISHESMLREVVAKHYLTEIEDPEALYKSLAEKFCGFSQIHVHSACTIFKKIMEKKNLVHCIPQAVINRICCRPKNGKMQCMAALTELCDWYQAGMSTVNPMWFESEDPLFPILLEPKPPAQMVIAITKSYLETHLDPDLYTLHDSVLSLDVSEAAFRGKGSDMMVHFFWELREAFLERDWDYVLHKFVRLFRHTYLTRTVAHDEVPKSETGALFRLNPATRTKLVNRWTELFLAFIGALEHSSKPHLKDKITRQETLKTLELEFTRLDQIMFRKKDRLVSVYLSLLFDVQDRSSTQHVSTRTHVRKANRANFEKFRNESMEYVLSGLEGMIGYCCLLDAEEDFNHTAKEHISKILTALLRAAIGAEHGQGWIFLETGVDLLQGLDTPTEHLRSFLSVSGVSGSGILTFEGAVRNFILDFWAKNPLLSQQVYELFASLDLEEDARLVLNQLPDMDPPFPDGDGFWLEWCQHQVDCLQEKREELYLEVALRLMGFLDYGKNKDNVDAWELLYESLELCLPVLGKHGGAGLREGWGERSDWWADFHRPLPHESPHLHTLKDNVITALSQLII